MSVGKDHPEDSPPEHLGQRSPRLTDRPPRHDCAKRLHDREEGEAEQAETTPPFLNEGANTRTKRLKSSKNIATSRPPRTKDASVKREFVRLFKTCESGKRFLEGDKQRLEKLQDNVYTALLKSCLDRQEPLAELASQLRTKLEVMKARDPRFRKIVAGFECLAICTVPMCSDQRHCDGVVFNAMIEFYAMADWIRGDDWAAAADRCRAAAELAELLETQREIFRKELAMFAKSKEMALDDSFDSVTYDQ